MDEFPTEDEEFEMMYADELELLNETQDSEKTPKKSRKSLNFGTNGSSEAPSTEDLFEQSFTPLLSEPTTTNNVNKRSIQELFRDMDDILYENQGNAKRLRGDGLEADYQLIDHILEMRKLNKQKDVVEFSVKCNSNVRDKNKDNISSMVPKYPFVAITRHDGERIYIRCHSDQYEKEEQERIVQEIIISGSMSDHWKQTWQEALLLLEKQQNSMENVDVSIENNSVFDNNKNTQLWVDLYKPRKYFELLSDESINRVMLQWIKLWDKLVFKRRPKVKVIKKSNEKFKFATQGLETELCEDGRPYHKVALLCGPPGLGKTTLAHMVARQAGYNAVEVNASDDRSIEAFKNVLENATQMKSVIDEEKRPNCIIFDEIDGAPATSIDYLVKFVNGVAVKGKKKKKESHVLKRPIICICNDVYVPSLRSLRQIAFVLNFPSTSNKRLAERLMEIARKQNIKTDMGAMMALAEKSNNDIRSCLSVLHFYKSQNKAVTLSEVHKSSIGQKDMQQGIFDVWKDIFFVDRIKGEYGQLRDMSLAERMKNVLNAFNSFGDYEKLAQGVYENYLHIQYKNANLCSTWQALDWFCFNDFLNQQIYLTQNYDLANYLQYAGVVWHFAFSTRSHQQLRYPSVGYEVRIKANRQRAIIRELIKGVQPHIRPYIQPISLTLDILNLLSRIIVPTFRPISLHLYSEDERKELNRVVSIMIDYNLTYVQERTVDGNYIYKMDPNIDEVVNFGPKKTLSYSNRQIIAKEIEMVKMHRFESPQQQPHFQEKRPVALLEAVKSVEKPARDFFGRVITKESSPSGGKTAMTETKNDIWYRYKEGYSNAVRKNIKMLQLK